MDKSWIMFPRTSARYLAGLNIFLDFADRHGKINGKISCPCSKCNFKKWHGLDVVREHLIVKPFPQSYKNWVYHGETGDVMRECSPAFLQIGVEEDRVDPVHDVLRDAFGVNDNVVTDDVQGPDPQYMRNAEARTFFELMEEADKALYPGCEKYSKLSFLIKLYHIKCLCGISDRECR